MAETTAPTSSKAYFQKSDGSVVAVHPDDIETAQAYGWKPVAPKDVARTVEANTFGGQAKTFGESLATGAFDAVTALPRLAIAGAQAVQQATVKPFVSPEALDEIKARNAELNKALTGRGFLENIVGVGSEAVGSGTAEAGAREYGEAARTRAETNPTTALTGTIAGQVIGSAGLSGALKGSAAPLAEIFGGGVAGRLGASATIGAIEGAPLQAVAAQDSAYLENKALTGEQILAQAGLGAVLGAGVSTAVSGLGEIFGAGKQAITDKVLGKASSEAGESKSLLQKITDVPDEQIQNYAKDQLGVVPSEDLPSVLKESVHEGPAVVKERIVKEATENVTQDAAKVVKASNEISEEMIQESAKRSHVEANLRRSGLLNVSDEPLPEISSVGDIKIDRGGMRPESLAYAKEALEKGEDLGPVEIHKFPGEQPFLNDGRHRLQAAMEAGRKDIDAQIRIYDSQGKTVDLVNKKISLDPSITSKTAKGDAALTSARDFAASVRAEIDSVLDDVETFGKPNKQVKGLAKTVAKLNDLIQKSDSPTDVYMASDQVRRDLLTTLKQVQASARAPSTDVSAKVELQNLTKKIGETYKNAADFLMDKEVWGSQGAAQADVNTKFVNYIKAKEAAFPIFTSKLPGELDLTTFAERPTFELNEGKMGGLIRSLGKPEGAFAERQFKNLIAASKELSEAIGTGYELAPEKATALKSLQESTASLEKSFPSFASKAAAVNQAEAILEAAHRQSGGATAAAFLGHLVGGHLGAAAGFVGGLAANPAKLLVKRLELGSLAAKAQERFGQGLDAFFTPIVSGGEKAAKLGRLAAIPTAIEAFQGRHDTPEKAYKARMEELADASANFGQRVRDGVANRFRDGDPETVASTVNAATRAIDYVKSKAPGGIYDSDSLTPMTSKSYPSRAAILQFASIWHAAFQPMSVLKDLATGTVTPDQIDCIKTVYPQMYQWMQKETMARLRDLDSKGVEVPIRQRMLLDTLLDLGGAGERTFSPKFVSKYSASMGDNAQQQQGPRPRPGPSKVASRLSTGTTKMLGEAS